MGAPGDGPRAGAASTDEDDWATPTPAAPDDVVSEDDALPPLAPGTMLGGRYELAVLLGRGGMGTVYAARDHALDEEVALKVLHPRLAADPTYRQRLRAEVRLARRVSHPNVCRVHDLGADGDHLFVTMERIRGRTMRSAMQAVHAGAEPSLPLATAIDLIVQLCSALAAAHRAGVLHRDVKPDNVMIGEGRALLTDFGVAGMTADPALGRLLAGTPAYIAPEVLRGEPFDARSDVFGAAVVAFELLAGVRPFAAHSMSDAIRRAHDHAEPPPTLPPGAAPPAVREALDRVMALALASDPRRRVASADRLAELIAAAARGVLGEVQPAGRSDDRTPPTSPSHPRPTATPTPRAPARRPEVRVATVLVFRCDALGDEAEEDAPFPDAADGDGVETRILPLTVPGEDLERIVVDLGGTPIAVEALAITALFGAPVSLGDDAERAARAARALIDRTRGGRAGLDTTRVVLRAGRSEPASADALAAAIALARAAAPGEALASPATGRQLAAHWELTPAGEVGGARALRLGRARPPAPAVAVATYRARELDRLEALAERSFAERRPGFVQVRAPAGYGKTKLLGALAARLAARREVDWLVATAAPLGETAPLALLRSADPAWLAAALAPGLADRGAALAAARRWLENRATRRPVVVAFEDVQWADEVSRELIDSLRASLDDLPVFVLTFSRSLEPAPAGVDELVLGPLDDTSATALVREIAPAADDDAIADVVARAAGHPFFLEELARELIERPGSAGPFTPLPATVEAVIQARLDRLPEAAREVVMAAAVVGRNFWREAAARALPRPQDDDALDDALAELERAGLITPAPPALVDDDHYVFTQGVVRDVAYQRLSARERRAAHGAVATWLERQGDRDTEVMLAIAHHRDQAGDGPAAAALYRAAGIRCLELFAYREAAAALGRAARLVPAIDAELAELLGDATMENEPLDVVDGAFCRAQALVGDDPVRAARLWYKRGTVASRRGDTAAAIACFERGLALAAPGGTPAPWAEADPRVPSMLDGMLGWVLGYQLGDNERGLPYCERAVARLEGTPYRPDLAHALSRLGATYMRAGRFRDQLGCNRRNLAIAEELGDLSRQLVAHINLGVVLGVIGDIDGAIAHTEDAGRLCTRTGSTTSRALVLSNLAGYLIERGDLDRAQRELERGIELADRAGERRVLPEAYQFAARIRAARGDLDGARRWASQALAMSREAGGAVDEGVASRLIAEIHARAGRAEEADRALAEATRLIGGSDEFEAARTEAARWRVLARRDPESEDAGWARAGALAVFTRLGTRRELEVLDDLDEVR